MDRPRERGQTDSRYRGAPRRARQPVTVHTWKGAEKLRRTRSVHPPCIDHIWHGGEAPQHARELLQVAHGQAHGDVRRAGRPIGRRVHLLDAQVLERHDIREVAQAYAGAVKDAKQMDITSASPDKLVSSSKNHIRSIHLSAICMPAFVKIPVSSNACGETRERVNPMDAFSCANRAARLA